MSLSADGPGVRPGWFTNGPRGQARIQRQAKKFARRRLRRTMKKIKDD